ncbi:hypothetical protein C8Q79DRAFT_1033643 [Trametes meyenii]|nr:hypothetical protein C8Q79DRAFT_1033643 [Trametes meyenii]
MSERTAALKQKGNDCFKNGEWSRASRYFMEAEKIDPNDPIYPSNLSAALYESGNYVDCIQAILRSWSVLRRGTGNVQPESVIKLSSRLARALCQGICGGTIRRETLQDKQASIKDLRETALGIQSTSLGTAGTPGAADLSRLWQEWSTMEAEMGEIAKRGRECRDNLSRLPHFMKPLDDVIAYFSIGMDQIIDLTQGWEPRLDPYPLQLDKIPVKKLSTLSFLFGGVGDGRHAFGTLVGLQQAYKKLENKRRSAFHAHLNFLDIHPATIGRNLCMLMLIHHLCSESDPVARVELKATLMYAFLGAVMPSYCYDRLVALAEDLQTRLSRSPPDLPAWLQIEADTVEPVRDALAFWVHTRKSTRKVLEKHMHSDPLDPGNIAQMMQLLGGASGELAATARSGLMNTIMQDALEKGNKQQPDERRWYTDTKVFLPPVALRKRHPGFDAAWRQLKKSKKIEDSALQKIREHIESDWKPNILLYAAVYNDTRYHPDGDGYRKLELNVFQTFEFMAEFNRKEKAAPGTVSKIDLDKLAWDVASTFFDKVVEALRALSERITVELVAGGLSEVMAKDSISSGPDSRKYMRMWLSNVPDYTHGPMNLAIYVMPNLDDDPDAGAACNCLFNRGSWPTDGQYFTSYTYLLPQDFPRYLGCRVVRSDAVSGNLVLGSLTLPQPLEKLATREELATWLTRMLFNVFIPGRSPPRPYTVRLPHNLVAFFGLLVHLRRVGFPGHWLSGFLARVLSGSMVSDIAPYANEWPVPVEYLSQRVAPHQVRTDPWLVEFESIIASAYYALPFPVATALPADFSRDPDDIVVWEAQVAPAIPFSTVEGHAYAGNGTPYDPVVRILFYKRERSPGMLASSMRSVFSSGHPGAPAPGTFFVLTAAEDVQIRSRIRFRLSQKRMERIKGESWSMVAYREDTGEIGTCLRRSEAAVRLVGHCPWTTILTSP